MSKRRRQRRRQSYAGCWIVDSHGELRLRYRWEGKQRSQATGLAATEEHRRSLEDLRELVGRLVATGRDPAPLLASHFRRLTEVPSEDEGTQRPTVGEYYVQWLREQIPAIRKAQARDYRRHVGAIVVPRLGAMRLADLRPSDVRGVQAELLESGLSVKYVRNILSGSFRAMIRQAVIDEHVRAICLRASGGPNGAYREPTRSPQTNGNAYSTGSGCGASAFTRAAASQ
jgi:hypothetical protein